MLRYKRILLILLAVTGSVVIASAQLGGVKLEDLLKIGGVALVVDKFGPELNKQLNKLQGFKDSETLMTKVVPIISVGSRTHVGAAQVMGPPDLVKKVKAVAQLETSIAGNAVRLKALIPVESKSQLTDIKRVVGVGVSAIVDLKI